MHPKASEAYLSHQVGSDFCTVQNNTTIIQPKETSMYYLVTDLHARYHGSHSISETKSRQKPFEHLGIDYSSDIKQSNAISHGR